MSEKNVRVAKSAGFCFGVKRAVDTVYEQIKKANMPIYTYGPIIHNEEVVRELEEHGVLVINEDDDLDSFEKGIMIIRSHGVSKDIFEKIKNHGFEIVDATCPFVKKIHKTVEEDSNKGNDIIIIGNPKHPEVIGIKGWATGNITIIENEDQAREYTNDSGNDIRIVSQTTFNYNKFNELVEIISEKCYNIHVLNTICNATEERQTEAKMLASESEAMIVIGGRNSSNTQKLFEICKKECANTYYIQTLRNLDLQQLKSVRNVGITAGASTPHKIIEEVQENVRRNEF